ncbi:MAG: tetratricopeptide repeat protein [Candidatus Saccharibacteria bacterium]|nr:tetratricopeptide repeat protein [Rhodoferax sp.]
MPALIYRADALAELERNREAISDYESAVVKRPDDAQIWLKKGLVNEGLQRKADATKAYRKALVLNPNLPLTYNNLAWMAVEDSTNLDQALAWSIKATTLAPNVPQFHDTLDWIYRARNELELSRKSLEIATKLAPPQADVHYHLRIVLQEQGKKKEAEVAFKQALRIDENFLHVSETRKRLGELSR